MWHGTAMMGLCLGAVVTQSSSYLCALGLLLSSNGRRSPARTVKRVRAVSTMVISWSWMDGVSANTFGLADRWVSGTYRWIRYHTLGSPLAARVLGCARFTRLGRSRSGNSSFGPCFSGGSGGFGVWVAWRALKPRSTYTKPQVTRTSFPSVLLLGVRTGAFGVCVKSIPPNTENWLRKRYNYSMNNDTSTEDKHETYYINNKCNDMNTRNMHIT